MEISPTPNIKSTTTGERVQDDRYSTTLLLFASVLECAERKKEEKTEYGKIINIQHGLVSLVSCGFDGHQFIIIS
jgi:hypothetical protein